MNAQQLADLLRSQASRAPNQIQLNDATLGTSGLDALVLNDLRRADGTLRLVVDPATIPRNPPAAGFTLAGQVPAGLDGFLALDNRDAQLQFSVNGTIGVALTVQTQKSHGNPVSWVFSQSFSELAHLPFDSLTLAGPDLQLSTGGAGLPAKGFAFAGELALEGLFKTIADFTGASSQYPLAGTLDRDTLGLRFDLTADLGIGPLSLGTILTMDGVGVGVALIPVRMQDGTVQRLVQLYLGATVTFTNSEGTRLPLDLRAAVPINAPGAPTLLFTVQPTPGFQASLDKLGSLIGGATWDAFFNGPAAVLKPYFATFGLKGYSTTFALASASVTSISLQVGTLQPWTMWGDNTLTLDARWQIIFLGKGQSFSTLALTADFEFNGIGFEVEVTVPDLTITGTQKGDPLTFSLDELNRKVFDGSLQLPPGLLTVSVSGFTIDIAVARKQFGIGAVVSASVAPFGTPLLAIHQMAIGVNVDASGATKVYTARLSGQVALGPIVVQADATVSNQPGTDTVFTLHLVDETVGSMINHLAHLVDPTFDISFGDPWNKLLDISLDALVLQVNLTKGTVSLAYDAPLIDLGFISITRVGLLYTKAQGTTASSVQIELEGTLLGQPFGVGKGNPPLGWDAINDAPPAVPGAGSQLFDLQYAGLGQHIGFATQPATVQDVMKALRASVIPTQPGQLPVFGGSGGLQFQEASHWLIGAQFSVMGTVAISAVFNDPNLYGILIALSGEKAKIFAGLQFEILYRKVTDTIGVYHIELKLPDAMRNLQFGEVSVTLPVVVLDIYTNGNFRVDFGFPRGLDFSNSFSVQVFPFVGYGGLYFALLDGATSTRVPRITNGTWSPVVEFGVALSLGVGKTVDEGILSGGITVTVIGIVQGVLAWFNPTDAAPRETYYWLQGTVAIVGRLYATINFAIIQASLDVTAYASVTLTIESHQPIYIAIRAGVSVRVSVKIVFFTIHLSFSATVEASFTIGSASATPWQLAPGNGASPDAALRTLRGERTLHSAVPRHAGLRHALMLASLPRTTALTAWPAVRVLPQGAQPLPVFAIPAFTRPDAWTLATASRAGGTATFATATPHDLMMGDPVVVAGVGDASFDGSFTVASVPGDRTFTVAQSAADGSATGGTVTAAAAPGTAAAVLLLAVENSIDPGAATLAQHRLLAGADPASAPFNLLMQAMLGWGIHVETAWSVTGAVRAAGVATVTTAAPHRLSAGDTVVLDGGSDASFAGAFTVTGVPTDTRFTVAQSGADASSSGGTARYAAAAVPVTAAVRAGGTATVTTGAPHGLAAGDPVLLAGVADASFDGAFTVAAAGDATTFTVAQAGADARSAGGAAAAPGVTAAQLGDLRNQLQDPATTAAAFDYGTLTDFLAENFTFQVSAGGDAETETGVALFPMVPAILLTDTAGTSVDFGARTPVDAEYQAKVQAYFQLLQAQFQARAGQGGASVAAAEDSTVSMAKVVFSQYFAMLMSAGAKAALDLLAQYPFTTGEAMGIAEVGAALGDATLAADPLRAVLPNQGVQVLNEGAVLPLDHVVHPIRAGETFAGIAAALAGAGALNAAGAAYSARDLLAANPDAQGIFSPGASVAFATLAYTTQAADTLNGIAVRILLRAGGTDALNTLTGLKAATTALLAANPGYTGTQALPAGTALVIPGGVYTTVPGDTLNGIATGQGAVDVAAYVQALLAANPGLAVTDPTAQQPLGTVLALPPGAYTTVAGDTPTRVAAYGVAAAQGAFDVAPWVTALLALNPGLAVKDPAAAQPAGTALALPPVTRVLAAGDTIDTLAVTLVTTPDVVGAALLAVPAATPLLSPRGALAAPLRYPAKGTDTFAGIAAAFNLTIHDVADAALRAGPVFAAGTSITVTAVPALRVGTLNAALLRQAEWNNASGMVSRFLLSGLRLPDPADPDFQKLTVQQLRDPANLAGIVTRPLFALTGQQFPIAAPAPDGYRLTLANHAGVPWLTLGGGASLSFGLTDREQALLDAVATTPLDPQIAGTARLALFQMVPPRIALQNHVAWQAPTAPLACQGAGGVTGNPSVWMFPDTLVLQVQGAAAGGSDMLYELVTARHTDPGQGVEAAGAGCYGWATRVDFTVSLPMTDGPAPAAANALVVDGADDTGAALLQQLYAYLSPEDAGGASLYLLYPPDPAAGNASGLASDVLDPSGTFLLRTNLSTLTHSGGTTLRALAEADPTAVDAARLADTAAFIALLWEASVTRSGGFYLNYAGAGGGAPLPPSVFGNGSTATLSLLVVLDSQAAAKDAAMQGFNNCAVVGDNIDTTVTTVFVQPATYTVRPGDSFTSAAASFDATWKTSFTAAQVAALNASVPLLLLPGAALALPAGGSHEIAYGDTLAAIAAAHGTDVGTLLGAGSNATAAVLSPGAQMQLAQGVLRPQATVAPGTVGFEATRANPDPDNLPYAELTPAQTVGTLFNLLGWTVDGGSAFLPSGAGLPTTPADSLQARTDGLSPQAQDDAPAAEWYYQQTLSVSPFATVHHGSASPALPPAAANPYNGVGYDAALGSVNQVAVDLDLQDIYGNLQPVPAGLTPVSLPVGYFDDVVGLASWPSLAVGYAVTGPPAALSLSMSLQQARYVPAPATPVDSALASIQADLQSYTRIVYQLAQPDLQWGLETTLDAGSMAAAGRYPLPGAPFAAFAAGTYVYLSAMGALRAVNVPCDGTTTVDAITADYGLTAAQLFAANQGQPYAALFGTAPPLAVPQMYSVVQGDTPASIAADPRWSSFGLTATSLAQQNAMVPLMAGTDLAAPARTVAASSSDSFLTLARGAHAAVEAIATGIAPIPGLLAQGTVLTFGTASYPLAANDTLANAALALGATAAQVAVANQYAAGIFVDRAAIPVADVLAAEGDTLASLATLLGSDVPTLAAANAATANLWAPATPLYIGPNAAPRPPQPDDTLGTFAAANGVTPDVLGEANPAAPFADGASVAIPGVLANPGGTYGTFTAGRLDTLGGIAGRFGAPAADVAALNPDIPGLLLAGQTVTDSASGKSVPTQAGDTFDALVARFAGVGVTVQLAALAADVAEQKGLLAPGALWITPPLRGDGGGSNAAGTLAGVAAAYGTDVATLAAANAAALGLIAPGVTLPLGSPALVTGRWETLNSIANRLAGQGTHATVGDVAAALAQVQGLVAASASVLPVPPPSPAGLSVALKPSFTAPVFAIAVNVYAWRDPRWIDPDFAGVASVGQAVSPVAPQPDAADTLAFRGFAGALQGALPGLAVATGAPVAEDDPASAATFWAANFGNGAGPAVTYQFRGEGTVCYALPPLSTSLMAGTVDILPYESGTGLGTAGQPRTFQAVDLDVWLNTFLEAVDAFLAPAFAVPAFAAEPAVDPAARAVVGVVEDKRRLATALSARVRPILEGGPAGSLADAQGALFQALLAQLSSAFTVSSLVQVPVAVTGGTGTALSAPRLSGKLTALGAGSGADGRPSAFSFSTAKVALTSSGATATFLFSVKSPAEHRQAQLTLDYVVNELELPDPASVIGDYQGSSWLTFVLPLDDAHGDIGAVDIPVPLRAYPGPAALLAQAARQSVDDPGTAAELLGWDFGFVYQHDDAEQDTPMVVVAFNGDPAGTVTGVQDDPTLTAVFAALARFMAVYPALRDDLALLPLLDAKSPTPAAQAAVQAFAALVGGVADAFSVRRLGEVFVPPVETYAYQLQKDQDAMGDLTQLVVTSVDPATGQPRANPVALWPVVYATVGGSEVALPAVGSPTATAATYRYPAGIAADAALPQRFVFAWPGGEPDTETAPWPPLPPSLALPGPQTYAFTGIDPLSRQSGRAGISIARNLVLVKTPGVYTADAFVYRTPLTTFASSVAPSIAASDPIPLGAAPTEPGEALGTFLKALFTSRDSWQPGDQVNVRLGASYAYDVTGAGLPVLVPVLLVPGFAFAPTSDWDWTQDTSFVSQVQAGIAAWAQGKPLAPQGSYVFDLTVYASRGLLQPLIHATTLRYDLSTP